MELTHEEVQHIAILTRLGLTPEELEQYRTQLSAVLEHFQVLQEIDTEGVPPGQSVLRQDVMRDDEPAPSLPKEETMANAPDRQEDYFRVRAVLE